MITNLIYWNKVTCIAWMQICYVSVILCYYSQNGLCSYVVIHLRNKTLQIKYVITSQIYYKVTTIFHTWKVFVELIRVDFDICKVQGECPLDCNLLSIILHPFLFMSFSFGVSHRNIFNEAISIQGYMSYLLFFPTGFFGGRYAGHIEDVHCSLNSWGILFWAMVVYAVSFSPYFFHWVLKEF